MTITHNRLQFPESPYRTLDYVDISNRAEPPVERRWERLTMGIGTVNLFWRGACMQCNRALWDTHGTTAPDEFEPTDYITATSLNEEFTNRDGIDESEWLDGVAICRSCHSDRGYRRIAMRSAQNAKVEGLRYTVVEWPEAIVGDMQKRVADKIAESAHLTTPHPVEPKHGAYLWVPDKDPAQGGVLAQFDEWTEERGILTIGSPKVYKQDEVEVLTAAIYGLPFENGIFLPASGRPIEPIKLESWSRGNCRTRRIRDQYIHNTSASHVAIRVPVLDPTTETLEQLAERLGREKARLETIMHRRMVAEGVARQWCETFDPILDATGLQPRQKKAIVKGTMTFEVERDQPLTDEEINGLQDGTHSWGNYISSSKVRVVTVESHVPEATVMLS